MKQVNFETYQSPFTWRYASDEMRRVFSEINKRKNWRKVWVALARAEYKVGLLTKEEFVDIEKNAEKIDIARSLEIEKEIYHDVMAEIRTFAQNAKVGGGKIHLGATSTDIDDNAEILRIKEALLIIEKKLVKILKSFATQINRHKNTVCMGYTHLQPAEPTILGYRFALYAQDLLTDLKLVKSQISNIKTKGMKGAIGTSAAYVQLLEEKNSDAFKLSNVVMEELGLSEVTVSGQTYPRKTDYLVITVLASIAQSLHKFCFDIRLMQSPNFGEWSEPMESKRVGSSAMPFKRNPDKAEKVCSLARFISAQVNVTWANAANSLLERTLDDSASKRVVIAETFLATDEILETANNLISNIVINKKNIKRNLENWGPFSAIESLMMTAVKNGADRQKMHEKFRKISMQAWEKINNGEINPLINLLKSDKMVTKYIKKVEIFDQINPANHIGIAQDRCQLFLKELDREIKNE